MSGVITNIDQLDLAHGLYTYADYIHWQLKERLEILKGKIFKMSPAPAVSHQKIARNLTGELYNYFKGKTCQLFSAPFDVVLKNKNGLEDSVVQPDLCVVCDPKKLENDKRCVISTNSIRNQGFVSIGWYALLIRRSPNLYWRMVNTVLFPLL